METALTTAVLDPIGTIINWFRRGSLDNTTSIGSMGGDNGIWHRGTRAGGGAALDLEDLTGAVEAWKLDEASGNVVGAIAATAVVPHGTVAYGVTGSTGYDNGVFTADSSGFKKGTSTAALEPGTSDFNVFFVTQYTDPDNNTNVTPYGTGHGTINGFFISWQFPAAGKRLQVQIHATDATNVTAQFSGAAVIAAYNDGDVHTLEFQFDRSGNCELFVDGVSVGTASIATLDGKSVTSTGVGIGNDYRGGFRTSDQNIFFIRQKHTLT